MSQIHCNAGALNDCVMCLRARQVALPDVLPGLGVVYVLHSVHTLSPAVAVVHAENTQIRNVATQIGTQAV